MMSDIAEEFGRGPAHISVRHNFQLHWITAEALPLIFERLWRSRPTTMSTCSDDTRNITGRPLAGRCGGGNSAARPAEGPCSC